MILMFAMCFQHITMEGNERYAEKHYSLSDLGDIDRAVVASKCYMDFLWQLLCRVDAFIAKNRQEQVCVVFLLIGHLSLVLMFAFRVVAKVFYDRD